MKREHVDKESDERSPKKRRTEGKDKRQREDKSDRADTVQPKPSNPLGAMIGRKRHERKVKKGGKWRI